MKNSGRPGTLGSIIVSVQVSNSTKDRVHGM